MMDNWGQRSQLPHRFNATILTFIEKNVFKEMLSFHPSMVQAIPCGKCNAGGGTIITTSRPRFMDYITQIAKCPGKYTICLNSTSKTPLDQHVKCSGETLMIDRHLHVGVLTYM